jgi:hypothetical protein
MFAYYIYVLGVFLSPIFCGCLVGYQTNRFLKNFILEWDQKLKHIVVSALLGAIIGFVNAIVFPLTIIHILLTWQLIFELHHNIEINGVEYGMF